MQVNRNNDRQSKHVSITNAHINTNYTALRDTK